MNLPLLIQVCVLLVGLSAVAATTPVFPGAHWEETTPGSQGVDLSKLEKAIRQLAARVGSNGVQELVIIRHGRMIWKGEGIDRRHGVWSATKSFTSTVLGLLIEDAKCTLDTRVANVLPELKEHYPDATLRHFTTMTSGYRAVGDETAGSYKHGPSNTPFKPNPQPLFTPPGSQYAYWDSAMNTLGLVLTKIAGEPIENLFRRRIAEPIGMKDWDWGDYAMVDGLVVNGGSGNSNKHIVITAREMARFGLLFLNRGNWNGRQLVSAQWVAEATRVQVPASMSWAQPESDIDGRGVYGFNWWRNGVKPDGRRKFPAAPEGMFWASGYNNNQCFVIPEWDMVIVRLGLDGNVKDEVWDDFFSNISAAIQQGDPEFTVRIATVQAGHTLSTGAAPSPILEQAARGIETHRKGDATIRLVRKDGTPAAGLRVEVIQRTHDFAFGNLFRPRHYTNERYRARFLEMFNFIQLLEFNWGQYERDEGQPKLAERRAFIDGWCRTNGLTRFYGHMLTWSYQVDEARDIGPVNPFWLMRHDRDTQFRLLRQRIEREVRAYRDVAIHWDVVNEPIHCRRWGDWKKPNDVDEPIADVLPYVREALQWAHEADPNARLLINDYRILPANKYRDRYRELVALLKQDRAPLHAIGIQAHSPGNGAHWFSPEEIWQTCELFGTQLGYPVYFTEFWQVSDPQRSISGAHAPGRWSPELQADAIEQFYRVAFGHPAVEAIIYFGLIDGETESPTLGLLDANFLPKPAWIRLKQLLKEEWHTRQSGTTDAASGFRVRGFFGRYDVRVTDVGSQRTFTAHLAKGQPNNWSFTLE